ASWCASSTRPASAGTGASSPGGPPAAASSRGRSWTSWPGAPRCEARTRAREPRGQAPVSADPEGEAQGDSASPLAAIRVLDLSRVLAGPYARMLLGDMGAEVWKVERPGEGDETRAWGPPFVCGTSAYFLSANRNKRSAALDFNDPAHRAAV